MKMLVFRLRNRAVHMVDNLGINKIAVFISQKIHWINLKIFQYQEHSQGLGIWES